MSDLPPDLDEESVREWLISRLADLKKVSDRGKEARNTVMLDQQSVGRLSRQDALQQQEMANAQEARRQRETHHIEQALERLGLGEYGWCADCGEVIATKRLEIDPLARLCIQCAS